MKKLKLKDMPTVKLKPRVKVSPLKLKSITWTQVKKVLPTLIKNDDIESIEDVLTAHLLHLGLKYSVRLVK